MRTTVAAVMSFLAAAAVQAAPPTPTDLLRLVPTEAQVVLAVDGAALRGHPLVQEWLLEHQAAWSGVDDDAAAFLRDAGLDPMRDVDAMVVAMLSEAGEGKGEMLALFGGRYDPSSLGAALVSRGATPVALAGGPAYQLQDEHHGRPFYLKLTNELIAAGSAAALEAARVATGSAMVREETAARRLDTGAPFWVVVNVPERARRATGENVPPEMRGVVQASRSVQRLVLQARLTDTLELSGWARATTAENAELLRDAAKGALAAARLGVQEEHPELVEVLRDVEVKSTDSDVALSAEVPMELVRRVLRERDAARQPR